MTVNDIDMKPAAVARRAVPAGSSWPPSEASPCTVPRTLRRRWSALRPVARCDARRPHAGRLTDEEADDVGGGDATRANVAQRWPRCPTNPRDLALGARARVVPLQIRAS